MFKFNLLVFWLGHWLGSCILAVGLRAWAVGAADSGVATVPAAVSTAAWLLELVLLQPAAYWILAALQLRWWTWAGLIATVLVTAINSGIVAALARLWWRRRVPSDLG